MDKCSAKLALARALTGLLGVGGVSIATAQEDADTSTTVAEEEASESTTAPDDADREDCPDRAADHADASADADS
ncbi:MAG: hypothetical protein Q8K58_12135 [Acidimicrobiales bacterium]|nr:hypothetical protein [Acidimicrobiales bacterium]